MAVAFSSPLLGHLKMQGKRLEKPEREYGTKPGREEK
jgi:hypothetical protein